MHEMNAVRSLVAPHDQTLRGKLLEQRVFETSDFGEAERCKVFIEKREDAFRGLGDDQEGRDARRVADLRQMRPIAQFFDVSEAVRSSGY